MSRHDDDYRRGRPSRQRDYSEDLAYSNDPTPPYPPVGRPEIRMIDYEAARAPIPAPPAPLPYPPPPQDPYYGALSRGGFDAPRSPLRQRSIPPDENPHRPRSSHRRRYRRDSTGDYSNDDDYDDDVRSPVDTARHFVNDNFSHTTTGIGVGVLGALVGGLAAREAVELTGKHNGGHHNDPDYKRNQMIGTVVGAAVGALGANAFEKRLQNNHDRERSKQEDWERRRWPGNRVVEKREIMARPRSGGSGGSAGEWREREPPAGRRHNQQRGFDREVDPDARSWKDVEDWVCDDRKSGGPSSHQTRISDQYS